MKKLTDYIRRNSKILLIALLLVVFIVLAIALYGGKSQGAETTSGSGRSENETKLMRILSEIDGVGQAEVMITESENGIEGIIVVCQGADSIITRNDVINAVTTAFNIEKTNIAVYAMNK